MMTRLKKEARKYLNILELSKYIFGMSLILVAVGLFHYTYVYAYEALSPADAWYEYGIPPVKPLRLEFVVGATPKFVSDITYHKTVDMRWEDTLWCYQDGGVKKYPTQLWPVQGTQRKIAGTVTLEDVEGQDFLPYWDYSIAQIDKEATSCFMRSVAIGTTPLGFEKTTRFTSETFFVNK